MVGLITLVTAKEMLRLHGLDSHITSPETGPKATNADNKSFGCVYVIVIC